jgi:hypothetical protein
LSGAVALGNFELLGESGIGLVGEGYLYERERRLAIGAANYFSFVHPGRTIRFTVVRSESAGSLIVRSKVTPNEESAPSTALLDYVLDVGDKPEILNTYDQLSGPVGKARKAARSLIPIQYDVLHQIRTDVEERRLRVKKLPRTRAGLSGAMDLRGPDVPVAKTLPDADVLVITSENEGLTLTSSKRGHRSVDVPYFTEGRPLEGFLED